MTREEAKDLGRIRRSLTDRKIAGVAGGVARHFDIDPLLVRVAFVLLAIFGGGGILAYAAGWLLIPEEGSDEGVIRSEHRTRTVLLAAIGAVSALSLLGDSLGGWSFPWPLAIVGLVVAAVAAASRPKPHPGPLPPGGWIPPGTTGEVSGASSGDGSSYPTYQPVAVPKPVDPRKRGPLLFWFTMVLALVGIALVATVDLAGWHAPASAYPAAVLAVCGVMLLVGSFYGRAGGLILVGLLAALATLAATAVQDISAGQIEARPASAAAVDDDYSVGAGEVVIDLTHIDDLDELDGRTIHAEARFGHVLVEVPDEGIDVTVTGTIDGAGTAILFGDEQDESHAASHDGGVDVPHLTIDAEVLFGQIDATTKEPA